MLLLVYSSKPTSWQPDRSLQQDRAPLLIYAAFPVFFFSTSFTLVQAYIACSASLVLPSVVILVILLIFLHLSDQTSHLPLIYNSSSCSRKNILTVFGLDIHRCILWILRQPLLRLPVVFHYSGFIPASLLNNIHKTFTLFSPTHHSCSDKTAFLHVRIYSERYVVIYFLHSNVGAVWFGELFINSIISLEVFMPKYYNCLQLI